MKKRTTIFKKITKLSFAAVSCASLILAPANGINTTFQNYCITACASSNHADSDTIILSNMQDACVHYGNEISWISHNYRYELRLTKYGNLTLTDRFTNSKKAIWSSNSGVGKNCAPSSTSFRMVLQNDGNLVIYSYINRIATAIWNTQTVDHAHVTNHFSLRLSNQGELYIYDKDRKQSIWSSRNAIECTALSNTILYASQCISSKNRRYRAVMQGDGNFVIYGRDNNGFETATWHTHTSGSPGAFFALQQDGNLVVYHPSNKPLYYTGTSSTPYADYKLSLGDDGVLRLVRKSDHKQIWTSG